MASKKLTTIWETDVHLHPFSSQLLSAQLPHPYQLSLVFWLLHHLQADPLQTGGVEEAILNPHQPRTFSPQAGGLSVDGKWRWNGDEQFVAFFKVGTISLLACWLWENRHTSIWTKKYTQLWNSSCMAICCRLLNYNPYWLHKLCKMIQWLHTCMTNPE